MANDWLTATAADLGRGIAKGQIDPIDLTDAYFDAIDLRRHLRDVEVVLIEAALEKTNGTISGAAEALNLRRTTLIEKMKKLMIEKPTDK